jgi:hypothetical protein
MIFSDIHMQPINGQLCENAELRTVKISGTYSVRSPAEKLWLVCGVVGGVMPCDREI